MSHDHTLVMLPVSSLAQAEYTREGSAVRLLSLLVRGGPSNRIKCSGLHFKTVSDMLGRAPFHALLQDYLPRKVCATNLYELKKLTKLQHLVCLKRSLQPPTVFAHMSKRFSSDEGSSLVWQWESWNVDGMSAIDACSAHQC